MYIPNFNREDDLPTLLAFMHAHSFATLVTVEEGIPVATHLPLLAQHEGERVTLRGHVAKANSQWRTLQAHSAACVIFQGPHGYISPALYEKRENVPTWNYVAVHAYGAATLITEPAQAEALIKQLITRFDPPYLAQWATLPEKYRRGMLNGIVAFEIAVNRLAGKYKLSQNRSATEQRAIIHALEPLGDPDSIEMAGLNRRNLNHHAFAIENDAQSDMG